jgi:hypothetical protein
MFNSLLNGWSYLTYNPDEELTGGWSREELEAMDARFVAALEQAFRSGRECRNSARAKIGGMSKGSPALARQRARQLMEAAVAG